MAAPTKRMEQIENRLRGNLTTWKNQLQEVYTVIHQQQPPGKPYADPNLVAAHTKMLNRIMDEMANAEGDLTVIDSDLRAAKSDAEYREVLVRAWPVNHFLDRMTYLGTAVLGAGGAAFVFVGLYLALFFWLIGGALMGAGLGGLWERERKKWDFYADQFSVEEQYRPWRTRKAK
jgi:hypothetical protein